MRSILVLVFLVLGACAFMEDPTGSGPRALSLRGDMIHACECDPYCPCPFKKDETYSACRSLIVWIVDDGATSWDFSGRNAHCGLFEVKQDDVTPSW